MPPPLPILSRNRKIEMKLRIQAKYRQIDFIQNVTPNKRERKQSLELSNEPTGYHF